MPADAVDVFRGTTDLLGQGRRTTMPQIDKTAKSTAVVRLETEIENLDAAHVKERRNELIEILRTHQNPFVLTAVIRALASSKETPLAVFRESTAVVREPVALTELLEVLGDRRDLKAAPLLRKFATHKPPTFIRGAAIVSLGLLGRRRDLSFLKRLELTEKNRYARESLFYAMYRLGDKSSLDKLLRMLGSRDYRVRCGVANLVGDLGVRGQQARGRTRNALKTALASEPTVAARSAISAALRNLRASSV